MKAETEIEKHKQRVHQILAQEVQYNDQALKKNFETNEKDLSLPIKILVILGALLSGLFFMGFLLINGLLESGGGFFTLSAFTLALAVIIEIKYPEKIAPNAFSLTFYIIGLSTLSAALFNFEYSLNATLTILILLTIAITLLSKNHITTFSAAIGVNVFFSMLILFNEWMEVLNLHVLLLLVLNYFIFYAENIWIKMPRHFQKMYLPLRGSALISLVGVLSIFGFSKITQLNIELFWVSSMGLLFCIAYIFQTTSIFNASIKTNRIQTIISILLFAPLVLSPAVLGGVFIMLLSFRFKYNTGLVLGAICFIYFIGQFYYDLALTLFTKSLLLMLTGILFLFIYYLLFKNNFFDEKNEK
jgi:hypothetical protein